MPTDHEQFRVFAERYAAAWCSMDPAGVAAHYAPQGSLTINWGTPAVGRDALTAAAASFHQALPYTQLYFDDLALYRLQ